MLRWLRLTNFRSFQETSVQFAPSGLTVIIGANGSGKSNLIKALDFIGTIAREGLDATVRAHGNVEGIVPKAVASPGIKNTELGLEYEFDLPPFEGYPASGPKLICYHKLVLEARGSRSFSIKGETLSFAEPLLVQEMLQRLAKNGKAARRAHGHTPSRVTIERNQKNKIAIVMEPLVTAENAELFLDWFGMRVLAETFEKRGNYDLVATTLAGMFDRVPRERPTPRHRGVVRSLLDPGSSSMIAFSSEAQAFQSYIATIRRYDMDVTQLRQQQTISSTGEIATDGRGMPAAVRHLQGNASHKREWARIAATLADIAPYISDTNVSQLRSGQEFVQFVEQKTGRPVESWHASDGTLRALAILLALETHQGGVLLVEEPEQGLHPWAIRTLVGHMREVIRERRIQVVLTTHSQHVLECVDPAEVVIASRERKRGTRLDALTDVCSIGNIPFGEVGRLWVSGLLGAVPNYNLQDVN